MDYTIRTLRFDRAGVDWIVDHAQELRGGSWPGDISYEYVEFRGKTTRASFENIVLIIAELDIRVKRCGLDGLLVEQKMLGKDEKQIARERCLYEGEVKRRINKVLWYCASGSFPMWWTVLGQDGAIKREGLTYDEWKRRDKYTRKFRIGTPVAKTP